MNLFIIEEKYTAELAWKNRYEELTLEKYFQTHIKEITNKQISFSYEKAIGSPQNYDIYQNLHFNLTYIFPIFCKENWCKPINFDEYENCFSGKKKMTSYLSSIMNFIWLLFSRSFKEKNKLGLKDLQVFFS